MRNRHHHLIKYLLVLACGFIFLIAVMLFRYPADRDSLKVFYHAGPNVFELFRTLDHYRKDLDPRKYEAAKFLIRNMDLYYFKEDEFSDKKVDWVSTYPEWDEDELESGDDSLELAWDELKQDSRLKKIRDAKDIRSGFLISHINQIFELCENSKWKDHFTFDQFCEFILPYKTNQAKPSLWVEDYTRKYGFILDSAGIVPSPAETAYRVWDTIQNKFRGHYLKLRRHLTPAEMENVLTGDCVILADWLGYIMKSVGLPVANIYTPKWANSDASHHWNAWMDREGNWREIMSRGETVNNWEHVPPKIFVRTGGKQSNSFRGRAEKMGLHFQDIPPGLRLWNIRDITGDIIPVTDVTVVLDDNAPVVMEFIYLSVFDRHRWIPIHWAEISNGEAHFNQMGPNALYMPVFYKNEKSIPAGPPFLLLPDGTKQIITPDSTEYTVELDRVYPLRYHTLNRNHRKMISSTFEASNMPDFSLFDTLFVIEPNRHSKPLFDPDMRGRWKYHSWWQEVNVKTTSSYRYIRFHGGRDVPCVIGDVELYDATGEKIPIENAFGPGDDPEYICDGIFGEPFQCEVPGSWVTLDLGKQRSISQIRYIPKDIDPASIQRGDIYKLSSWVNGDWAPVDTVKAFKKVIPCKLYGGALYLLENQNRPVHSRPFVYNPEEDAVQWW